MSNILKVLFVCLFCLNSFSNDYIDSITLSKIKKMVQKEEEISIAYKNYIKTTGKVPEDLFTLITNDEIYLPKGYSVISPFGKEIKLNNIKHQIESFIPSELKSNLYDYYYTNKNRTNTKAPLSLNSNVNISLSSNEKFIVENTDKIKTIKSDVKSGYYLDEKGILHWYDANNKYKFSITNDLLVDQSVSVLNDDGTKSSTFSDLVDDKNFLYAGQKILRKNEDNTEEYINKDTNNLIDLNTGRTVGQTLLRFSRRGGGMIVNGDIYTWGNNVNKIVGIGKNTYTKSDGTVSSTGTSFPIVTTLVRAKALSYDDSFDNKNFYSSPIRPKFIDFFSSVWHSTCGITTKGELYCGGGNALESSYISFEKYTRTSLVNLENLYRSTFFNGVNYKAKTIFSLAGTYLVLGKATNDTVDGYNVYYWGVNNANGWAGTGNKSETNVRTPTKVSDKRFKDLVYTISEPYRKVAGIDYEGDIYTWGLDTNITSMTSCDQTTTTGIKNFCTPMKVESTVNFTSIFGGQRDFIATDTEGKFYKISQPKISTNGSVAVVTSINDIIKNYTSDIAGNNFNAENDARIISVDISSKSPISEQNYAKGIVWVNSKNQLKGDYFTEQNKNDPIFQNAISKIKWIMIRVIEDKNGMCGIDINYQMYCWGDMTFYAINDGNNAGNTFMLPVFMANLHDENKDFLLAEGGLINGVNANVSNMTSYEWTTEDAKRPFFMKYPTYIGGFNYEFIFK